MTFLSTYDNASIRGWQSSSQGPIYIQNQELLPNISNANIHGFGTSVDVSYDGNYVIVGETDFINDKTPGQAIIFIKNNSTGLFDFQQAITPNVFVNNAWYLFGTSVSMNNSGSTAVIGASGYNTPTTPRGAAYIFDRSGNSWSQIALLQSNDANSYIFGQKVDMSYDGNIIAIVATDNQTQTNSGAVYIYNRSGNTFTKTQKLKSSSPIAGEEFGRSISISQDLNANYIAIAASASPNTGTVFIFNKSGNNYIQQQQITGNANVGFGRSVSINNNGNILLVGSYVGGNVSNAKVDVYTRSVNTWSYTETLFPPQTGGQGGISAIAQSGDSNILFVGDGGYPYSGGNAGPGTVFTYPYNPPYYLNQTLQANNGANDLYFGGRLACSNSGNVVAISGNGYPSGNSALYGSVYIFTST